MTDDIPVVPIRCESGSTTSRVPISDLADTVDGHNQRLHDDEDVATVDLAIRE
jgi:hypothetical protein